MLESLRNAAGSWVAKIFIALLVMSFAVWGVADIFTGYGQRELASVGDTEISPQEFQQAFQREVQEVGRRVGRPISTEQARALGLDAQVLGRLVTEATLNNDARVRQLGISDEAVAQSIVKDPAFQDSFGNFNRAYFEQVLRANGLTERSYAARERSLHKRQQIAAAISAGAVAPDTLIEAVHQFREERRALAYMVLTVKMIDAVGDPDDAALNEYYEARKGQFRAPEYRKVELIEMTPEALAASIPVSEDDLKAEYEARKDAFHQGERRQVEQILFKSEDDAKAAAEKIKAGTSFAEIAKEQNLSDRDIALGLVEKKDIVDPTIADAAFALTLDTISDPVKGKLGTALLRITKIEPEATKTFEDVADSLRKELARRAAEGKVLDLHDQVEDERAAGSTFAEIAEKFSLTYRVIDAIDAQGRDTGEKDIENIPSRGDVLDLVFQTDPGVEVDPLTIGDGGFLWLNVTDVTPSRERTLEEIKGKVVASWRADEERNRLGAKASDLVEQLKGGADFAETAKKIGAVITLTPGLQRTSTTPDLSRAALETAFATPVDGYATSQHANGTDRIVFQVRRVELPPYDGASQTGKAIAEALKQSIGNDNLTQYVADRQAQFGVSINQNALAAILGPR